MKIKNLIAALSVVTTGAVALAYTVPVEIMTVIKLDGTKQEYKIDDVDHISFDMGEKEVNLVVSDNGNVVYSAADVDPLFRYAPTADSNIQLIFGTVDGATGLADLKSGKYIIMADLKPEAIGQTLTLGSTPTDATVKVLEYTEGELSDTYEAVTAGTISTSVNNKTKKLTVTLEAVFNNGLDVKAYYSAIPIEVESIDILFPEEAATNSVFYYNSDGVLSKTIAIASVEKKQSGSGMMVYTIKLGGGEEYTRCEIQLLPEYVGKEINFAAYTDANTGAPYFIFQYDLIQVASPNGQWRNQGLDGTMSVVEDGETIRIKADVTNKYYSPNSPGVVSGTPERAVVDYQGAFVQK